MKRFLLPLIATLALPHVVSANIDPKVREACLPAAEIQMAAELIDNNLLDKRFMRELEDDKEYDAA